MEKAAYSLFARYYDEYMAEVDYDRWVDFVLSIYSHQRKQNPRRILELACGTGNITSRIMSRGFEIWGTDSSAQMIELARKKHFAARYQQQDMLAPLTRESWSLILLMFDSINYLLKETEIKSLLDNINQGLESGGMFIFDISTSRNCEEHFDGFINIEDNDQGFMIHESDYNPLDMIQTNHITFFVPAGNKFERYDEYHKQRIYKVQNLVKLIRKSPLKLKGIYKLLPSEHVQLPQEEYSYADRVYNRLFFVMEKTDAAI